MVYGNGFIKDTDEQFFILRDDYNIIEHDDQICRECRTVYIEIIPETLGGYIGKEDKYDKDIYEGDIPKVSHDLDEKGYSLFYIDTYLDFTGYVVSWENIKGYSCITHIIEEDYSNVEIIGNIHENPELMEGINDKT